MSNLHPSGKLPDDDPLLSIDFDEEKTPFERLASAMYNRIMDLEFNNVTPTVLTKEAIDVPFGQFGEERLCASLRLHEDGELLGNLSITGAEKPILPRIVRIDEKGTWSVPGSEQELTDDNVLRKLDRYWPIGLYNNDAIHSATREEIDTVTPPAVKRRSIFDIISEKLQPYGTRKDTVKSYKYTDLPTADEFADPEDARPSETVIESWWASLEDSDESTLSIKLIHSSLQDIEGYTAKVEQVVSVDEEGGITVEQNYKDTKTSQWIDLPIEDEQSFVDNILFYLNSLVIEKIDQAKKLK